MSELQDNYVFEAPMPNGEVHEEREDSPEIGSMHITQEPESLVGAIEDNEVVRERTESTTSASSESWQNNDEVVGKLRQAQSLLDGGATPLQIIRQMFPDVKTSNLEQMSEQIHFNILSELLERSPSRKKLLNYNSLDDAIELFRTRKNILVLTGAGVSVSCGIPDFRSKDGIYARLRSEFPDLPDPTAMFDIRYFRANPAPFYNFAKDIFPGQFVPSVSHRFIKELESSGRLLRNYTQNIDTLEHQTGIKRVVECHGSFSKCTCTQCGHQYDGNEIRDEVLEQRIAYCKMCKGVIKPNIVFFGEDLGQDFHRHVTEDKHKVDLVVVIGSSMKVRPVSLIPHCVHKDVPQILINRESLPHYEADIELLGNCDDIIRDICYSLGGSFTDMVASYDSDIASSARPQKTKPSQMKRKLVSQQEFLRMCLTQKPEASNSDRGNEENDAMESGEPDSKKPRLSNGDEDESMTEGHSRKNFEEIQKHKEDDEDDDSKDSEDVLATITQPRLLDITELLKDNKCLAISAHRIVFPGAEYLFDLETMKLVQDVRHNEGVDSSASSESDESESTGISRTTSVDDMLNYKYRKNESPGALIRCNSCDQDFKYDLSETVEPELFVQLCEELNNGT